MSSQSLPHAAPPRRLLLRLLALRSIVTLLALPLPLLVDLQLLDVQRHELPLIVGVLLPLSLVLLTGLEPVLAVRGLLRHALREGPGVPAEQRLGRLMRLPARLAFLEYSASWLLGGLYFNGLIALFFGRPLHVVLVGMALTVGVTLPTAPLLFMLYERALMPVTLEAFHRAPGARPPGGGLLLPRQQWLLPMMVVSILLTTCLAGAVTVKLVLEQVTAETSAGLAALREGSPEGREASARVHEVLGTVQGRLLWPVVSAAGYMALVGILTAAWAARRQRQGATAVGDSLRALVQGRATPPEWLSTDELGDLAADTWHLYASLQEMPRALQASAGHLATAGERLGHTSHAQNATLGRQAAALQQARTTAEEIRATSQRAAARASEVLQVAERAGELGREGEAALAGAGRGLADIRHISEDVHRRVSGLGRSAQEVGRVAEVVKGLADQSHMLALNAAIEATRAGEHGKGFGVVAREMRNLADRSIRATLQVRQLVEALRGEAEEAVGVADRGAGQVERALGQLHESSEHLRALAQLSRDTAGAVRHIADAVGEQHRGVDQLFAAVRELSAQMDETMRHLDTTGQAAAAFAEATGQVSALARRYVA